MIPWKRLYHLCQDAKDDTLKSKYPSPEMIPWNLSIHLRRWYLEICISISGDDTLKSKYPSPEMIPWNLHIHLRGWFLEKGSTIFVRMRKMIPWNLSIHLRRWYLEISVSISGDDTLKSAYPSPEMIPWNLSIHLRRWYLEIYISISGDDSLKKAQPSLSGCERWYLEI